MNNAEHIWILMARKLSGEASAEELQELDQLLRQNPHVNYSKEILQDFWRIDPVYDRQYAENKYRNLVQRLKNLGIHEDNFTQDDHFIIGEEVVTNNKKKKWGIALGSLAVVMIITGLFFLLFVTTSSPMIK